MESLMYGNIGNMGIISWMLLLIPLIFSLWAQAKVKGTFSKFSKVNCKNGITAERVVKQLLIDAGVTDVKIERIKGNLTDHYDPRSKTIRLSEPVYGHSSISAIGVAAHETGHAIQHNVGYAPLSLRSAFVPIATIGSQAAIPLVIAGMFFGSFLIQLGIALFAGAVVFQLITLPVEFNASSRALQMVESGRVLSYDETDSARKVLNAAVLTYVASAAVVAQLIRLLLIYGRRN